MRVIGAELAKPVWLTGPYYNSTDIIKALWLRQREEGRLQLITYLTHYCTSHHLAVQALTLVTPDASKPALQREIVWYILPSERLSFQFVKSLLKTLDLVPPGMPPLQQK